jgi:hypothetical protein
MFGFKNLSGHLHLHMTDFCFNDIFIISNIDQTLSVTIGNLKYMYVENND